MGCTSLVHVSSQNIADDLAMIDLFETMTRSPMIVLWLMNLSGEIGYVGWFDQPGSMVEVVLVTFVG